MADTASGPDSSDESRRGPDRESVTDTPRWVKVFGIVALVLVLAFVITHLTGRGFSHDDHTGSADTPTSGDHGRHTPGGDHR